VIDLHLHTTASDGRSTPEDLVLEARAAGIGVMAVTDHDTVAGLARAEAAAVAAGVDFVPGIEITAVLDGRDLHLLGYFINPDDSALGPFLAEQRLQRRRRVEAIADRLADLGAPIDRSRLLAAADAQTGRSLGRPLVAAALIEAGHARDVADAFDRFLSEGKPAFVTRVGPPPAEVLRRITAAGGLSSFAHPGKFGRDDIIPGLVAAGLAAIEVYHPDHSEADVVRYGELARQAGLLVTGGSDYHGPGSGRADGLGRVDLPAEAYRALVEAQTRRR
jgi:predicted metal-dependent phosphoesterase TrpH